MNIKKRQVYIIIKYQLINVLYLHLFFNQQYNGSGVEMSFNFVIPRTLDVNDHSTPAVFKQDLYGGERMYGSEVSGLRLAGKYDRFLDETTPQGIAGVYVRAYNFTDKPLVMLDANCNASILEPILKMGNDHVEGECIVVDVMYLNQDQQISRHSEEYLKHYRLAWTGSEMTSPVVDGLTGAFIQKASQNRIYRFFISATDEILARYDDAFYFEPGGVVLGTIRDLKKILVHPKASDTQLKKARPKLESVKSLGTEIGVNDPSHVYDKVFTHVHGSVLEIPITRDPNKESGIFLWRNVHQPKSRPEKFQFDDPANPVKVYPTRTAAEAGGAPEKAIELELARQKLALAEAKIASDQADHERMLETQELAQAAAIKKAEADVKLKEQEAILREREAHRRHKEERNREHVENVSFWRKVLVEGAKTIGAIAATATVLIGWYAKKKAV